MVERSGELEIAGLAAGSSWELLLEQAGRFGVDRLALADPDAAARAGEHAEVLSGPEGLVELIVETDCDLVLNALVGSAGLGPTVAALGEGIDLALANKESLVVGGELVTALAEATGAQLIPVDSEHSALFQLLEGERPGTVDRLVLTASGGPFRGRTRPRRRDRGGGARAPDLADGREDHGRLRDADEQGARADRGPPPVRRAVRGDRRGGAPAVDRPRAGAPERRRLAGAPRLSRHASADLLRAPPPGARRRAGADARPGRAGRAHLRGARTRPPSPACAWRARRPGPAARRPAC